jgi:hypothetical protein
MQMQVKKEKLVLEKMRNAKKKTMPGKTCIFCLILKKKYIFIYFPLFPPVIRLV